MRCWGELKSLRAQSVGEVSAYWSCVQFSGYVEMKVSQAYNGGQKNLGLCEKALPSNCYVEPCS